MPVETLPLLLPGILPTQRISVPVEKRGVVYTKDWVVDLILDLAGYRPDRDLVAKRAIEPSAGDGAFLVPMARRLVASCRNVGRPLADCAEAIVAYELDEASSEMARGAVARALVDEGAESELAGKLASSWIRTGDFLLDHERPSSADFVIGNPPYIRSEDIPEDVAALYRMVHPTMKGRADIYVAFYEAALRSLSPDGVCAFICADRWMFNQYGGELRRLVTSGFAVETIIEMHEADAFHDDVSAYPAITIISKKPQSDVVVASMIGEFGEIGGHRLADELQNVRSGGASPSLSGMQAATVSEWFEGTEPWPCRSPDQLALLKRLEKEFQPLESEQTCTRVGIGVATGADRIFITKDQELVEASRLLPLAMGADTTSGELRWSGHYLVNPWQDDGLVDLDEYPRLRAYFERSGVALKKRHIARKNNGAWYRTIDRVHLPLTAKPKLYIPDIKNVLHPVLDNGQTYPHHNLYFVHSETWDHEVLGGLLMSAVAQFFVESYGVRMRGGYLRFQAQYLRRIRVPDPTSIPESQAQQLISAFRTRDVDAATAVALQLYRIKDLPTHHEPGSGHSV